MASTLINIFLSRVAWFWALLFATASLLAAPPTMRVTIGGVQGPMREAILARLSLSRESGLASLTEQRIRLLHKRAPNEIREALQPFGYYRAKVEASLDPNPSGFHARYRVELNDPVRVNQVTIQFVGEGKDDAVLSEWRRDFPLHKGDILVHAPYEQAKTRLQEAARRRGYFEAELAESRIAVSIGRNQADVTLRFNTGPRFRFGEVTFSETPLRQQFLERFIPFKVGDPFDTDLVLALQQALADSDYFRQVDVAPRVDTPEGRQVPVDVGLVMHNRTRYTFGLGYGTDTGVRGTIGFDRRWVNSRGHRFSSDLTASEILTELSLRYRIPLKDPTTDSLAISGDLSEENTDISDRQSALVAVALSGFAADWQRTSSLNYLEEKFSIGGTNERSTMLYPAIGVQRLVADDRLFPLHGWRLALSAKLASESVVSSADLAQALLRFKHVTTALGGRLISRLDAGISETDNFDLLPVSLRFFAGGDQSVRGYAYQSLGPTEAGDVIGGKNLLAGSIEYDRFFTDRWGAALFIDEGNAFNTSDFDLFQGAGFGVRFRLPFGVIRADIAQAVSDPGHPWRLHLTIGPEL